MGAVAANTVVSRTDSDGGDHIGALVTRAHGFDVIACAICGFRHAIPLPDTAELERAYRDAHYAQEKPSFPAHAGEDEDWASLASKRSAREFRAPPASGKAAAPRWGLRAPQARP